MNLNPRIKRLGLVVLIYSLAFLVFSLRGHAANKNPGKFNGFPRYAIFNTTMGSFKVKLYFARMPKTVKNFVRLADGTKKWIDPKTKSHVTRPFYNGLKFFNVRRDFLVQTGDPLNNGDGGPGYTIPDEFDHDLHHDRAGLLSMVRGKPGTEASQFIITLRPASYYDNQYPIFGRVVSGLNVVRKISEVPINMLTLKPLKPVYIKTVKIIRVK